MYKYSSFNYVSNNICSTCLEDEVVKGKIIDNLDPNIFIVRNVVLNNGALKHRAKTLNGSRDISTASISVKFTKKA